MRNGSLAQALSAGIDQANLMALARPVELYVCACDAFCDRGRAVPNPPSSRDNAPSRGGGLRPGGRGSFRRDYETALRDCLKSLVCCRNITR